jgi:hypothetical protein
MGPGVRGRGRLRYFPCRLSLVPALLASALPPDVVLVRTSVPSGGTVSHPSVRQRLREDGRSLSLRL